MYDDFKHLHFEITMQLQISLNLLLVHAANIYSGIWNAVHFRQYTQLPSQSTPNILVYQGLEL